MHLFNGLLLVGYIVCLKRQSLSINNVICFTLKLLNLTLFRRNPLRKIFEGTDSPLWGSKTTVLYGGILYFDSDCPYLQHDSPDFQIGSHYLQNDKSLFQIGFAFCREKKSDVISAESFNEIFLKVPTVLMGVENDCPWGGYTVELIEDFKGWGQK